MQTFFQKYEKIKYQALRMHCLINYWKNMKYQKEKLQESSLKKERKTKNEMEKSFNNI